MIHSFIYGICWAGICCLFDFAMWDGNILGFYWDWLNSWKYPIKKAFGLCIICFGFWFGTWFIYLDYKNYYIFLGISELILIFLHIVKQFYKDYHTNFLQKQKFYDQLK